MFKVIQQLAPSRLVSISLVASLASWLIGLPLMASQITVDKAANGVKPIVVAAPNGVAVVNIATPGRNGVSNNQFQQFSVTRDGAILNNSNSPVTTQLSGYIAGNSQLGTSPARVILNQVNGTNPSALQGYLEVAGQQAQVVVANPNGITCDGCGFINTRNTLLTTGKVEQNAEGLASVLVSAGRINIQGDGLNGANVEQLSLLGRYINIDAPIHSQALALIAGTNRISHLQASNDQWQVVAVNGHAATQDTAIDTRALGGLYADRIRIQATEAGLGVNVAGSILAQQGELSIDSNGQLQVTAIGELQAKTNLLATSRGELVVLGKVLAGQDLSLASDDKLAIEGSLTSQGAIKVNSLSLVTGNTSKLSSQGDITLMVTQAANLHGQGESHHNLRIDAQDIAIAGTLTAKAEAHITASRALEGQLGHQIIANNNLLLQAKSLDLSAGHIESNQYLILQSQANTTLKQQTLLADRIQIKRTNDAQDQHATSMTDSYVGGREAVSIDAYALTLTQTQDIDDQGNQAYSLLSDGTISISAHVLTSDRAKSHSLGDTSIGASGSLQVKGSWSAGDKHNVSSLTLTSADMALNQATLMATDDITLWAAQGLLVTDSHLQAGEQVVVNDQGATQTHATDLSNSTLIARDIIIHTDHLMADNSQGYATNDINLGTTRLQAVGQWAADRNLSIRVTDDLVLQADEYLVAGNLLTLQAGSNNIASAGILQGKVIEASAQTFTNSGELSADDFNVQHQGLAERNLNQPIHSLINRGKLLITNLDIALSVFTNIGGVVEGDDISVVAAELLSQDGVDDQGTSKVSQWYSHGDLSLIVAGDLRSSSLMMAADDIYFSANNIFVDSPLVSGADSSGNLVNKQGNLTLKANKMLQSLDSAIAAGQIDVGGSLLSSVGPLSKSAGLESSQAGADDKGNNNLANLWSGQGITLNLKGDYTYTKTTTWVSYGDITLNLTGDFSNQHDLSAPGILSINAVNITNGDGKRLAANSRLSLMATQDLNNYGTIESDAIVIDANNATNHSSIIGDDLALTLAGNFVQDGSNRVLAAANNLTINLDGHLTNAQGALISAENDLTVAGKTNARAAKLTNDSATIEAAANMKLSVERIYNQRAKPEYTASSRIISSVVNQSVSVPTGCSGDCRSASETYDIIEQGFSITSEVQQAVIGANGNLTIDADQLYNTYSQISASNTLTIGSSSASSVASGVTGGVEVINTAISEPSSVVKQGQLSIGKWEFWYCNVSILGTCVDKRYHMVYYRSPINEVVSTSAFVIPSVISGGTLSIDVDSFTNQAVNPDQQASIKGLALNPATSVSKAAVQENASVTLKSGLASQTLANLKLPDNALFTYQSDPGHGYLIETNSRFTDRDTFLSSDYMLTGINAVLSGNQVRVGDGYYETRLVAQQIADLTAGQQLFEGYPTKAGQYKALMDNAIAQAGSLALRPGIALSQAQIEQLNKPLVWLVEQEVVGPDGKPILALLPVVYLNKVNNDALQGGAIVAGDEVRIAVAETLNNHAGSILGRQLLNIEATENIVNKAGLLKGGDVTLRAQGDFHNLAQVGQLDLANQVGTASQQIAQVGEIQATANLSISAGQSILDQAGKLTAGNKLALQAGSNIDLQSVALSRSALGNNASHDASSTHQVSQLHSGGNLNINANNNLTLAASELKSQGALALQGGNNLHLNAVHNTQKQQNTATNAAFHRQASSAQSVNLNAQHTINLVAGVNPANNAGESGDINIQASLIESQQGAININAARDVNLLDARNTETIEQNQTTYRSSALSSITTTKASQSDKDTATVTELVGKQGISIQAGKDIQSVGSQLVSEADIALNATHNIDLTAAQNKQQTDSQTQVSKSGFSIASGILFLGSQRQDQKVDNYTLTHTTGFIQGENITINAHNNAQIRGVNVQGTNTTRIAANDVNLGVVTNTQRQTVTNKSVKTGIKIGSNSQLISSAVAVNNDLKQLEGARSSKLKAALALRAQNGLKAVSKALEQGQAINQIATGGVSISLGRSQTQSQQSTRVTEAVGTLINSQTTSLQAANDASLVATNINAQNINLQVGNELTIASAQNQRTTTNSQTSKSNTIGVGISTEGVGFNTSQNKTNGNSRQNSLQYQESNLDARHQLMIQTGANTTLSGAQLKGQQITANIGGDLTIQSQQDSNTYTSQSKQTGSSFSVDVTGAVGASLSLGRTKADANYQSVQEQTGLFAGEEGINLTVQNTTHLTGGAIASTAENSKNTIKTKGLQVATLTNSEQYSVDSKSFTLGLGTKLAATGGGQSQDSGSQSSTTQSVLTEGNITITNNPGQDLNTTEGLSRTTAGANSSLTQQFNQAQVQLAQEEVQAQQIIQTIVPEMVGDLAQKQLDQVNGLLQQANQTNDPQKAQQLRAQAQSIKEKWGEDGSHRTALHALTGLASGDINTALGNAATAVGITQLAESLDQLGIQGAEKDTLLTLASAAVGHLANGTQGAAAATGQTLNNYLKHDEQIRLNELELALATNSCPEGQDKCDRQVIRDEVTQLKRLDAERNQAIHSACAYPTSPECTRLRNEINLALEEYRQAGSQTSQSYLRGRQEVVELARHYNNRANNPDPHNIVSGAAQTVVEEIGVRVDLAIISAKAINGDSAAQQQLSHMAKAVGKVVAEAIIMPGRATKAIVNNVISALDEANQLEAQGKTDEATQLRAQFITSALLIIKSRGGMTSTTLTGVKKLHDVTPPSRPGNNNKVNTKEEVNFYRDGSLADTSQTMSAQGPWVPAANMTPAQANQFVQESLPASIKVTQIDSADLINAESVAKNYQPPFVPGSEIVTVTTTKPTKFVRVFVKSTQGESEKAGSWMMNAADIEGLSAQQIASKYSLPQVPTMITDVEIPKGIEIEVSVANAISPNKTGVVTGSNGGGGGVQFQVKLPDEDIAPDWFTNSRPLQ